MCIQKKIFLILSMCFICLLMPIKTMNVYADVPKITVNNGKVDMKKVNGVNNAEEGKKKIITNYKELVTFFGGIATISMVAIFIKHFIELGAKANNPMERRQLTSGLVWSGLAAACLGSVTLLFGIVYGIFK